MAYRDAIRVPVRLTGKNLVSGAACQAALTTNPSTPILEERRVSMTRSLGKMSVYKLFNWRDSAANTIQQTVQAFLELGEAVATRWIQTRKGVMLLQMVPDNNASGAIYVFDRQRDDWYMLSFEGCEDRFTSDLFDRIFSEYKLFNYVDQPGLLLSQMQLAVA